MNIHEPGLMLYQTREYGNHEAADMTCYPGYDISNRHIEPNSQGLYANRRLLNVDLNQTLTTIRIRFNYKWIN